MKTLKSFYEGHLKTEDIKLDNLVSYVLKPEREDFYTELKKEIISDGKMKHPILVVPISSKRIKDMITFPLHKELKEVIKVLNIDLNSEEKLLVIMKGNNRFFLAQELGCDKIECIVTEQDDLVGVTKANKVLQEH